MLRFLVTLADGKTIKLLIARIGLQLAALGVFMFGMCFLLASAFQALILGVGGIYACLIFGFAFVVFAALLFIVGSIVWKRRPRNIVPLAKLGAMTQALEVAKLAIRREPAKAIIAGVVLGAMAEVMAKPPRRRRRE